MENTAQIWIKREQDRGKVIDAEVKRMQRALFMQVYPVIQYLNEGRTIYDYDTVLQVYITPDVIRNAYIQLYRNVGFTFANIEFNRLVGKKSDPANFRSNWFEYFDYYVENNAGQAIRGVTDYTRQLVRAVLVEANSEGLDIFQTAKFLQDHWLDVSFYRAERIARTEVITASNLGTMQGAESSGLSLKKVWIATADSRTRDTHRELDGTKVGLNEMFLVAGNAPASYPGDPELPASERINCRCTVDFQEV